MASLEETSFMYSRDTGTVYAPGMTDGTWIELGCVECDLTHSLPQDAVRLVSVDD